MTQITFLHGARDRLLAMAAWLAQADSAASPILVFAPNVERGEQLDRLLWTHAATGFTPHCRADNALAAETGILLTTSLDSPPHDGCLVNLADDVPPGFARFQHLVEIISVAEGDRLSGRERFRFYRERGYPLENRDISGGV